MKYSFEEVRQRLYNKLCSLGMDEKSAHATANALLVAEMYGVTTHGLVVLPSHIKRIQNGGYNLNPHFDILTESDSFALIDADNSIGFASAEYCMRYAVDKCQINGIFTVFSRNANAYGAAFTYPLIAADANCIGITCCNAPSAMAPIGGKEKLLGTNPLAAVIPIYGHSPIIVDMATSKVAKSKFLQNKREGKMLEPGWALNSNGEPTLDPDEGLAGLVCPMEGFKGYGLALIIDFIAGLISGAAYQDKVNRFYNEEGAPMNVGHVFTAINPSRLLGDCYNDLSAAYLERLRNSAKVHPDISIAVPGDDKHRSYKIASECGIALNDEVKTILSL